MLIAEASFSRWFFYSFSASELLLFRCDTAAAISLEIAAQLVVN